MRSPTQLQCIVNAWRNDIQSDLAKPYSFPGIAGQHTPSHKRKRYPLETIPFPNMSGPTSSRRPRRLKNNKQGPLGDDRDEQEPDIPIATRSRPLRKGKTTANTSLPDMNQIGMDRSDLDSSTENQYVAMLKQSSLSASISFPASSHTDKKGSRSGKPSRTQSPSKKMVDLRSAARPVTITKLLSEDQFPSSFRVVLHQLLKIRANIGFLPLEMRVSQIGMFS